MSRLFRNSAIAVAGLFLLLVGASSASAALSINTTATTARSTNSTLVMGRATVGCTDFSLPAGITSAGAVSIAAGSITFAGCTLNGNNVSITQTAAWSGSITALLSGGQITGVRLDITAGGFRVVASGCTFTGSGAAAALVTTTATTPPALVSVGSITFSNTLVPNGLRATSISGVGCSALGIAVGTTGGFTGLFNFSPAVTGTLV